MVSFQCDACADTVKKPQLDKHRQNCWASFTCLDCSTTFRGQDYKSHTSCISEAEKYQGSLYKASKKGKQTAIPPRPSEPLQVPTSETPADSPSAIHPSRMNQLNSDAPPPQTHSNFLPPRSGRGGFSGPSYRGRGYGGGGPMVSAENTLGRQGGMRSWGSPAVTETNGETQETQPNGHGNGHVSEAGTAMNGHVQGGEKRKKRKGDRGGTGTKANSKRPKSEADGDAAPTEIASSARPRTDATIEPKTKKRKRETSSGNQPDLPRDGIQKPVNGDSPALSDETLKRLRKSMSKLEKVTGDTNLQAWLELVCTSKKETLESAEVMRSLKVLFQDGKWVLRA